MKKRYKASVVTGGGHGIGKAMAVSLAGRARVNSVSPGWINPPVCETAPVLAVVLA